MVPSLRITHDCDFSAFLALERENLNFLFATRQHAAGHRSPSADEAAPVCGRPQRSVRARRGDLQHVLFTDQRVRFQPSFNGSGDAGAILNGNLGAIAAIDPKLQDRSGLGPTPPQLDEIEAKRVKLLRDNRFDDFAHLLASPTKKPPKNKKVWGPSPHFRRPREADEVTKELLLREKNLRRVHMKVKMTHR